MLDRRSRHQAVDPHGVLATDTSSSGIGADDSHSWRRYVELGDSRTVRVAFVLVASALSFLLVMAATTRGPGIEPDSVEYFSAATSLAEHGTLETLDGTTLTLFPPGYPALIAAPVWVGVDPADAARGIGALSAGAIVALAYVLLRRHVRSNVVIALGTLLAAVAPVTLVIGSEALSEAVFSVVVLGFLCLLGDRNVAPSRAQVGALVVAIWIAFMMRYLGLVLVPLGAYEISRRRGAPKLSFDLKRAIAFTALAVAVPVAWMARNVFVAGVGPMGERIAAGRTLPGNVSSALNTATAWLVPKRIPYGPRAVLAALVIVALVALVVVQLRRSERSRASARALAPIVAFVILFSVALVVSASITEIDPLDNRLLSPILVPLIVIGAWGIETAGEVIGGANRAFAIGAVFVACAWLLVPLNDTQNLVRTRSEAGWGYTRSRWEDSPLLMAAREVPQSARMLSNDPWSVVLYGGHERASYSPFAGGSLASDTDRSAEAFAKTIRCAGSVFLVWFDPHNDDVRFLRPEALEKYVSLDVAQRARDGALYRVTALDAAGVSSRACGD